MTTNKAIVAAQRKVARIGKRLARALAKGGATHSITGGRAYRVVGDSLVEVRRRR